MSSAVRRSRRLNGDHGGIIAIMPGDGGGHSAASGGCRRRLIPAVPHTAAIPLFLIFNSE